jgi:hypothetical protein
MDLMMEKTHKKKRKNYPLYSISIFLRKIPYVIP